MVLSAVLVVTTSAVPTDGFCPEPTVPGLFGSLGSVVPVEVLLPPVLFGVVVVVVAELLRLPVAPALTVPVIFITELVPAAKSLGRVVLPVHGADVPPSTVNTGLSTLAGTLSVTVGVLAAAGPLLVTVIV